jgi:hypothetical protein
MKRIPRVSWPVLFAAIIGLSLLFTALDRYLEWDEAVFFSQSGGLDESTTAPMGMAPSREYGPAALIAFLRIGGLDLPELRTVWMILTAGLVVLAFRGISRHFGRTAGVAGALVYGTFWLSLVYAGSFYGSQMAGLFGLLAVVAYLDLRVAFGSEAWRGVALGLALAGAVSMRHVESLLLIAVLFLHSLIVRPASFWSRRRGVGAGVGVFVLALVVPWLIYSIAKYGSVGARVTALTAQVGSKGGLGWSAAFDDYLNVLVGSLQRNTPFEPIPIWPGQIMAALVGVFVIGFFIALRIDRSQRSAGSEAPPVGLVVVIAATNLGFFSFVYASIEIRDRYMTTVTVFLAVLVGWIWSRVVGAYGSRRWMQAIGAVSAIAWFAAQVGLVVPYEGNRDVAGEGALRVAETMRVLAESGNCIGLSRYGRPELQVGSGCTVVRGVTNDEAVEWAASMEDAGVPIFILWPGDEETLALGARWETVYVPSGRQARTLYYLLSD